MTIQEIERRAGLERANIRFYEREGLVTPARRENGYRDYSEEDLALLLKVKLLRRLGFSLEAIRALKAGAALDEALAGRLAELGGERKALDATEQVCREMRQAGADFASLDARHYLESYDRALRLPAGVRPQVPEGDRVEPVRCPWRRFFARGMDLFLLRVLRLCLFTLLLRANVTRFSGVEKWILELLDWAALVPLEAFCLSRWGTTPGKWLMGLRLEHVSGRRLTFQEALWRAAEVFFRGEGGTVPLLSLYRNWKSYRAVMDTQEGAPWDRETVFTAKEFRWPRAAGLGLVYAAGIALTVLCSLEAALPKNRGELTVEDFVENYNVMSVFYDAGSDQALQSDGSFAYRDGRQVLVYGYQEDHFTLQLTQEDDILTAVSFTCDGTDIYFHSPQEVAALTAMAFGWSNAALTDYDSDLPNRLFSHREGVLEEEVLDCRLRFEVVPGISGSWFDPTAVAHFQIERTTG